MELSEARRQWLNALADGVPAARAAQMLGYCRLLEERKRQCEQTLELADVDLNRSSHAMLQARQQREAVETLMAHQRERYHRRANDEERKLIDDLINRRTKHGQLPPGSAGEVPCSLSPLLPTAAGQQAGKPAGQNSPPQTFRLSSPQPFGPPPDALN
jgi:flagellar export protein FliJ